MDDIVDSFVATCHNIDGADVSIATLKQRARDLILLINQSSQLTPEEKKKRVLTVKRSAKPAILRIRHLIAEL